MSYRPDPAWLSLGDGAPFADVVAPARFPETRLRYRNQRWAQRVGLGDLSDEAWTAHFARFEPLADNIPAPLALRYHGHQFRTYNPDLGDGRGFLFAQLQDECGRLLDLGTKGSGKTPYSRTADGRLTLKGAAREVLATEMLEALGVYTSKTFSVVETGEQLTRHDEPSPTRAAVLTRLSHGHVRFGTFQRLAFEGDADAIRRLVDYCVRHLERPASSEGADPPSFFGRVVARTARLAAQWMAAGFVHGVLNTDNMNVTGESFDYGPWRFLPAADPAFTAAYFDQTGLYAFGRQAEACAWNLARLGGALTLIADADSLNAAFARFPQLYEDAMADAFFARLGVERGQSDDGALVLLLLRWMEEARVPFERVFYDWFCGAASASRAAASPIAGRYEGEAFQPVRALILSREPRAPARLAHSYFARGRPCTMLIDEVEALWAPIADEDDWSGFESKLAEIADMREAFGFDASIFIPA